MFTITNPKTYKGLIALFLMALLFSFEAAAQNEVAIGSATTKSNAILWLNGNGSQGLILPVVTNKSAVSNPDKGMVVYDDSDNKVWYRSNSAWVEVGSGTGGSTANLNLLLQGNQLQLRDGTTVQSTVNIAGGTQSNGAFLVFTGGSWQYATLSGDVTGANTALVVNGIKGKTVATLPATAQALIYDPTANSNAGGWVFQALTTGGTVTNITGTAPVTITNPATTPTISIANGGITNTLLATDAVNSSKIQDATITGADIAATTVTGGNIAATTITADKLAQSAASTGQVLKWNGTNWVPQNDDAGTGTVATLSDGQLLTGNGTTNTATTLTGDATLSGGVITIGNNAITTSKINAAAVDATKLADNSVTSAKISDATITNADIANGTITATKLAQSGANNNEVLQWNGTNWVPVTLSSGGTVTQINTSNGLTGGPITNSGTISIASSGVGSTELADNAVVSNKISDNAVTTSKINNSAVDNTKLADNAVTSVKISDGSITGADIAGTTITADKLAQSSATSGQVLKWNGTNWVPAADDAGVGATPTLSNGQILVGNGTTNSAVALSGDATLAGGVITIGNNSITTAKINTAAVDATKLADNSVTTLKVADNAITTTKINAAAVDATKLADGSVTNLKVANDAITSTKISNATVTGADIAATTITGSNIANATITGANIAATTITADKLAQSTATSGQVLKWNGTNWVPSADDAGAGATPTLSSGQILIGDGTTNSAAALSGDATLAGGVITISNSAINSAKIADATITGSDIATTTITDANINAAANIAATKLASTVVLDTETPNVAGDINGDFSTGLQIKANTITAAEITDASVTGADLATNIAISTTGNVSVNAPGIISGIGSGLTTLNATNISSGSLALARITPGTNGQVLTTTAGVPAWQTPVTGATTLDGLTDATVTAASSGQLLVNDGAGQFRNVGMSGDATISSTGAVTLNNGASTRTNLGLGALATIDEVSGGISGTISDQTIDNNDISTTAAIAGTKITPNFGAQNISTTGTLTTGTSGQFVVNATGNITKLNNLTTSFPSVQGLAGSVLTNDGAGALSWATPSTGWSLAGNNVAVSDFIGTTNAEALVFKTDNSERARFASNGFLGIGTVTPSTEMQIDANTPTLRLRSTQPNSLSQSYVEFGHDDGSGGYVSVGSIGDTGAGDFMHIFSPDRIIFNSNFAFRFSIGTNGELGVGGTLDPGTAGQVLTSGGSGSAPSWSSPSSGWGLTGNTATVDGTNYIGTTDNVPLNFRVNNEKAARIESAAGTANTLYGYQTGNVNTGIRNAGFGYQALLNNAAGQRNAAFGYQAMLSNTTGNGNTAVGSTALSLNTIGGANAAFGTSALANNTGSTNTAVGNSALTANTTASDNTAVGTQSLGFNTTGASNSALGSASLINNTTGSNNTGVGLNALSTNTTGGSNTALGYRADVASNALTNATAIGANATVGQSNSLVLGSINGVNGALATVNVGIGTTSPSANLDVTGDNGFIARGTLGAGTIPSTGAGVRMMFYPRKAAFRAGRTFDDGATESTSWDDANVGDDSFAAGQNTVASGNRSFATGRKSIASGDASVAMGIGSSAAGNYSLAVGFGPDANGQESVSIGRFSFAQSRGEIVLGYNNLLSGGNASSWIATDPLFQLGNGTDAVRSTAFTVLKNGKTSINGISPAVTLEINGTDAVKLPAGTSAERPATPVAGHLRYNSGSANVEFYNGSVWQNASASGTSLITNTGTNNLFAGDQVLAVGTNNAVFGYQAGASSDGFSDFNVFIGTQAAQNKTTGDLNTIVGYQAGRNSTTSAGNTFIGANAGQSTTSSTNTFIGQSTGLANTTGFRNVLIGNFAEVGTFDLTNAIAIGYRASVNQNNSLVLGSINGVNGATASTSVGIGTTTPSARLDISGNTLIRGTNTNAAPTVSSGLELMVGRSNFGTLIAGQTSADIALNWGGASGGFRHFIQTRHNSVANSNSNSIDFFVNNSTTAAGSIAPNNTTPNGNVLAMSMTAAGIGIGTAAPNANTKVHISGAGTQYLRVEGTGALATGGLELDGTGTSDWRIVPQLGILTFNLGDVNGTMNRMYLMNQGNFNPDNTANPNPTLGLSTARWGTIFTTVAVNVSSDRRLKNNIHNLNYGLKEILELRPVSYSLRSDKTRNTYLGLIAQEVQELIPEIVSTGDDVEKTLGMRYAELVPVLIKAIQEQQAIIETLKSENAASNDKTEKLNKEIEAIKARLGMTAKVEK